MEKLSIKIVTAYVANGKTVEQETYDRGNYTKTITRVTNGDKVDVYDDKNYK